jgi:transglutaminase-like putative cysteine protease
VSRALRVCIIGLVLVNLAFVHITEAARWSWLGPLVALTLASPVLVRFTRYWVYRLAWNLAVLGVFALLVQHVTSAGVAHLLEDGLLLAALCQVHLVNNLSRMQKPDLIFFNAFLIAVVTSYLSVELGYSLVFLVYAPVFVVSLQLLALAQTGVETAPGLLRSVVRSGLARSAVVLSLTLAVFLFWPRDFQRRGLLGLRISPPDVIREVAFSDRIDLGRTGKVIASDRVVMRVRLRAGTPADVPAHWRGATLDRFDGERWKAARGVYASEVWRRVGAGVWQRGGRRGPVELEVHLVDPEAPRLFAPLASRTLRLETGGARTVVYPLPDFNFKCVRVRDRRPLRYALEIDGADPEPGGRQRPVTRRIRTHIWQNPARTPQRARQIARDIRRGLPDDAAQHQVVEKMRLFLMGRYRYLAPGTEGGARDLEEFLSAEAGAHCEFFATALALMLRTQRIPCRVVTGYRSEEWDVRGEFLTVRARHAHAWVEVLDPEAGWYTVDPTPAVGIGAAGGPTAFLARLESYAAALWAEVTGFNRDARDRVFVWLGALPGRLLARWGTVLLVAVALALGVVAVRLRRQRRRPPAVRAYRRCLRRLGLTLASGETPRELVGRATDAQREVLQAATAAHEAQRYRVA